MQCVEHVTLSIIVVLQRSFVQGYRASPLGRPWREKRAGTSMNSRHGAVDCSGVYHLCRFSKTRAVPNVYPYTSLNYALSNCESVCCHLLCGTSREPRVPSYVSPYCTAAGSQPAYHGSEVMRATDSVGQQRPNANCWNLYMPIYSSARVDVDKDLTQERKCFSITVYRFQDTHQ